MQQCCHQVLYWLAKLGHVSSYLYVSVSTVTPSKSVQLNVELLAVLVRLRLNLYS